MSRGENRLPEKVLVCASADAELSVSGASFDRACSQCGARVMVAPSGRRALARDPELVLLCIRCGFEAMGQCPDRTVHLATLPPDDIAQEIASAQPNIWRKRN
jgi:predicted RNA-binding Zn-ribbon protein involved in translation (DUF1610 family)